jgi:uncharacterized protein
MPVHPGIRETLIQSNPDFQRLLQEHSQYEQQLQALTKQTYLNSEDLLLEIELKKRKLRVKDEIEQLLARIAREKASV